MGCLPLRWTLAMRGQTVVQCWNGSWTHQRQSSTIWRTKVSEVGLWHSSK